jgi:RNA polymerase sigma-70 factor, ECF subfamily
MAREWQQVPEVELLGAVIARQPGGWEAFYARYERLMISCLRKVLRRYTALHNDQDIEDMLSMVLLNLVKDDFKRLRAFDATRGYKLSSWVGLIATNTALDELRKRDPQNKSLDEDTSEGGETRAVLDPGPSPTEILVRREQWAAILRAISELPDDEQRFFALCYDEEVEPEVIAKQLKISVNTVYSRKNKIREKMKKSILGSFSDDSGKGGAGAA